MNADMPMRGAPEDKGKPHRWSGWPGAFCLDCGCEDPIEVALADGCPSADGEGEECEHPEHRPSWCPSIIYF